MANGLLNIFGTQYGVPSGNNHDQLSIPYSTISEQVIISGVVTNNTTAVPTGSQGVIVIPGASVTTLSTGFATSPPRVSPTYPSILSFDPASTPTNIYITTTGSSSTVTHRFF